jgi:2-dehydro-3-deoxyglucarate aldolase
MNRLEKIACIRHLLGSGKPAIGSWIQIPHASIAEIMGQSGYDWVAVDLEHGSIDISQLPDIFRALELGNTLPLVRVARGHSKDCKQALDAGAAGIIVPMVETSEHLLQMRDACRWPPAGNRGVGFSRANFFGKHFDAYSDEAQKPILVAMIEHIRAVDNLHDILAVDGLDAIFVGPYDLSASMGYTGDFDELEFKMVMKKIYSLCKDSNIPCGVHVVAPDPSLLKQRIDEGYQFIAYSIDSVFLLIAAENPMNK